MRNKLKPLKILRHIRRGLPGEDPFPTEHLRVRFVSSIVLDKAISELAELFLRDFVRSWHNRLKPSDFSFENEARATMARVFYTIERRARRIDATAVAADAIFAVRHHLAAFRSALVQLHVSRRDLFAEQQDIVTAMQAYDRAHPTAFPVPADETLFLERFSDTILFHTLRSSTYNTRPLRIFLRDLLSGLVFPATLNALSNEQFLFTRIAAALPAVDRSEEERRRADALRGQELASTIQRAGEKVSRKLLVPPAALQPLHFCGRGGGSDGTRSTATNAAATESSGFQEVLASITRRYARHGASLLC